MVRVLLILTVAVLVCVNLGFIIAAREFTRSDLLALVLYAGVAAFAWNSLVATCVVMVAGGVGVIFLGSGGDLLEMTIALALVSATCVPLVLSAYATLLVVLSVHTVVSGTVLAEGGFYGVAAIAVIALLAGLTFRIVAAREAILIAERGRIMNELGLLAHAEQEKIADELHDGIAHDLTLVLFHARALPLQPDDAARTVSLTTIEHSAERAFTSIQSLLALIRDGETSTHGAGATRYDGRLVDVLSSLAALLRNAGIATVVTVPPTTLPLSPVIERILTEIAIEAVTNIIKHAPNSRSARIVIDGRSEVVELVVANVASSASGSRGAAVGGRGMVRSRQRLEQVSGRLAAGPDSNGWLLRATVPVGGE
ncbi:sensor histidine kinase [Cryobacterium sp. Y11]|uniref:sensor histidine kinase n=1 Tax=Cryobacterium sp. Y11 TaxID=2045016 RepID=UPI001E5105D9|nr:histidine kinase [Cryobacterium sp. Y11]